MNLTSLFAALLQPLIQKALKKAGTWTVRQNDGKDKGDAVLAAKEPEIDAAEGLAASALTQVAAAHLANDKVAQQIGVATTEKGLAAAGAAVINGTSTLNVSDQAALTTLLSNTIVH